MISTRRATVGRGTKKQEHKGKKNNTNKGGKSMKSSAEGECHKGRKQTQKGNIQEGNKSGELKEIRNTPRKKKTGIR